MLNFQNNGCVFMMNKNDIFFFKKKLSQFDDSDSYYGKVVLSDDNINN